MTPQAFTQRFYEMKRRYIGATSWYYTIWLWIDYAFSILRDGASISDYFAYGFYKLRPSGRKEYITYRRYRQIMRIANNSCGIDICRNKIHFNNHFSDLLGREWIDTKQTSIEIIQQFAKRHPIFFVKEISGFRGIGIQKIDNKDINIEALIRDIKQEPNTHYILEEPLVGHTAIQDFHAWSINTIRIVTLYDNKSDTVYFMNALFRMGNKKNAVDNFHFGGIGANVDLSTGIINTVGYDANNTTYLYHPISHKQILGFQIPYWQQCLDFIEKAAKRIPTVRYVGWDLAIRENGSLCLIEANDNADHDIQQLHNKGLWKEYKQILKSLK